MHVPGLRPLAGASGLLSLLALVPTYLVWSGWAGVRLLRGRRDLIA
jgi:hypothetical protein